MPDLPNLRRSDRKRRLVEILDRYFLNTPARNENVEVPALTIQTNESDPLPSLAPILMTSYLRHTMSMKRTETVTEDSDESKPKKLSEAPQDAEKTHHVSSKSMFQSFKVFRLPASSFVMFMNPCPGRSLKLRSKP